MNNSKTLNREELLKLCQTELCQKWYKSCMEGAICDRITRLHYLEYWDSLDMPLPLAHLLVEEYMAHDYDEVDWQRITECYDLYIINEIAYLWLHPLVWQTPSQFTKVGDRFVITGNIAVEDLNSKRSHIQHFYDWKEKIMTDATLYFADNLPILSQDDGNGKDWYLLEGMIEWDRIMTAFNPWGDEILPYSKRFDMSVFRENIKLIARERGGTKAAEIIRKFQDDWKDIVHWGCFGIHELNKDEVNFFQKSLFKGFERELRIWESNASQTNTTNNGQKMQNDTDFCEYIDRVKLKELNIYTLEEFERMFAVATKGTAPELAAFLKKYEKMGILYYKGHNKKQIFDNLRKHFPEMREYDYPNFAAAF